MEITPDIITQFGLMNKISTGNSAFDILLCLLVPMLIRNLLPKITEWWQACWSRGSDENANSFLRHVSYETRSGYYYYDCDDPSNKTLQTALLNHVNRMRDVLSKLPNAEYQLKYKDKDLTTVVDTEDAAVDDSEQYDVNTLPPNDEWIDLDNGLSLKRVVEQADEKGKIKKTRFSIISRRANGNELIQKFIDEALEVYRQQQVKKVDLCRYMYIPVLNFLRMPTEEGAAKPSALYKRYKLSEEKTFASFFHPEREAILQLVDNFTSKGGKFATPGYPQKLGFLLYGPPGTGKTTFIKALAQYTKRSIISLPLTKIRTNQELMDIMFDQKVQVEDGDNIDMAFDKTIFVMEDVDAASDVVQRRTGAPTAVMAQTMYGDRTKDDKRKEDVKGKVKEEDREDKDKDAAAAGNTQDDDTCSKAIGPSLPGWGPKGLVLGPDDSLNLAGLLNVLDGIVDMPGRLVIMTTNHPEKLDPALIRPGRINKKIYLGRLAVDQALAMISHYFGTLSPDTATALRGVFMDGVLSPAELEGMCAEYDTTDDLVRQLSVRFNKSQGSSAVLPATASCQVGGVVVGPAPGVDQREVCEAAEKGASNGDASDDGTSNGNVFDKDTSNGNVSDGGASNGNVSDVGAFNGNVSDVGPSDSDACEGKASGSCSSDDDAADVNGSNDNASDCGEAGGGETDQADESSSDESSMEACCEGGTAGMTGTPEIKDRCTDNRSGDGVDARDNGDASSSSGCAGSDAEVDAQVEIDLGTDVECKGYRLEGEMEEIESEVEAAC